MNPTGSWIDQYPLIAVLIGIAVFLLYWAIHIAIAIWMHKDGKRSNNPNTTWWVFAFVVAGLLGFGLLSIIVFTMYAFVRGRFHEAEAGGPRSAGEITSKTYERGEAGSDEKTCPSCGTVNADIARFCKDCGHAF